MEKLKLTEEQLYQRARKKVKEIRSFYINLLCYCIVIPTLATVNLIFTPEYLWFIFSMIGWGLGLTFHGMAAFDYHPFLGKNWEERKIKELLEKENSNNFN